MLRGWSWNPFKKPRATPATPPPEKARQRNYYGGYTTGVYVAPLKDLHRSVFQTGGIGLLGAQVIARTRQFALTNPFIESYLRNMLDGVVGARAITPNFATIENQNQQKKIKKAWRQFAENVTVYNKMTMRELQRAIVKSYLIDGRTFLVFKYADDDQVNFPVGFRMVHLEKEMLDINYTDAENRIINGIEYDKNGVITKYHFHDFTTAEYVRMRQLGAGNSLRGVTKTTGEHTAIDANMVLDICDNGSINQAYNYPSKILSVLQSCLKIESIDSHTLDLMEMQAKVGGFFKTTLETPLPADATDAQKLDIGDIPPKISINDDLPVLPPGVEFQDYSRSFPNMDAVAMRKEILRSIAASLGVDYAALNSDGKESNYSSMRAFSLLTRQTFFTIQMLIEELMMRPIVFAFLQNAQLGISEQMKATAAETSYDKRIHHAVDPQKDATAQALQITMGLRSINSIAREYGADVKENLQELAGIYDSLSPDAIKNIAVIKSLIETGALPPEEEEPPPPASEGNDNDKTK